MEKSPFEGGVTNLEGSVSGIDSREVDSSSMYLTVRTTIRLKAFIQYITHS